MIELNLDDVTMKDLQKMRALSDRVVQYSKGESISMTYEEYVTAQRYIVVQTKVLMARIGCTYRELWRVIKKV